MKTRELIPDFDQQKEEILELINSIDDDYKEMDFDTFPMEDDAILAYLESNYPDTYDKLQLLKGYFSCECTYAIDNLTCAETYIRRTDAIVREERPLGKIIATLAQIRLEIILEKK